jgi:hypothetical protein
LLRSQSGDLGKTGGIRDGEISQDFSIKTNACDFKPTHEFAVGQFIHTRRRINPNNPQSPEVSFADTTITIGIHERLIDRIRRCAEQLAMASTKPLGQIQYFFSPSAGFEPSFNTHGIFSLSLESRQEQTRAFSARKNPARLRIPAIFKHLTEP